MKIIQLTDIHLTAPGNTIRGRDPRANFERALEHILKDHADAELMVITGDLSDWGDRTDYEWLRERIQSLPMPVRLCIGNHDDRPTFLSVFPEYDEGGFVQGAYDISVGRCLFLDTWGPETHAGFYCEQRQAWLEQQLSQSDGPFLLFMHHNPIPMHIGPKDQIRLLDDVAFRALVGRYRDKIRHIFFGHCHIPVGGSTAGIPTTAIRGTNHASYPLFAEKVMLSNSDLPESYGVAFVGPDYVTVHMVEFGYQGEIRIQGSPDYKTWDRATMQR